MKEIIKIKTIFGLNFIMIIFVKIEFSISSWQSKYMFFRIYYFEFIQKN